MKKCSSWIIILILLGTKSFSQIKLSSFTINSSGQSVHSKTFYLEWSVTEMVTVQTMKKEELLISSGILQPEVRIKHKSIDFPPGYIKVFPTIAESYITVLTKNPEKGILHIVIVDMQGRIFTDYTVPANEVNFQIRIPLVTLASGLYYLQAGYQNSSGLIHYYKSFTFLKL